MPPDQSRLAHCEFVAQDKKIVDDAEEKRLKQLLTNWCQINFAEAFMMMMHLKRGYSERSKQSFVCFYVGMCDKIQNKLET